MHLSVAISILLNSDNEFRQSNLPYVKDLLRCFVSNCQNIYGSSFSVYSVHGLLHLHEDADFHNCSLNDISCFPFENFLQCIKRSVRNGNSSLVQICKRGAENFRFCSPRSRNRFTKMSSNERDGVF